MKQLIHNVLDMETEFHAGSPPAFPYPWAPAWGEDRYGLWMALDFKSVRTVFRWILPGMFWMGSLENENGRFDWEDRHRVTISHGFWLGETAVTQALWRAVRGDNPGYFKGDNLPVEQVSWDDVQAFIETLNRFHPALKTRLPWEAEWEYACRAGSETAFHFGDELHLEKVNYRGVWDFNDSNGWGKGARRSTAEVKSYPCNAWGLYEMHGNVWEWCADAWQEHLGKQPQVDPWRQDKLAGGAGRVIRGGSWFNFGRLVRSAHRSGFSPDGRNDLLGFRLALGH
ncbi:Formylglycine-generating enzyme, required for sulfatase activity, contains SUMF1/FGE domain [Nitrosomonas sp. Nm51]|uniref:formylglycine-generating enzyme family protein n=1 Tax=Nitrosomonas sp. Nm51 TaxID=133720 RepID=UPI0008C63ECD|nr:formylglycine-generating enzyme family protein [Nitrosomonas sp. Nm51]SEQ79033.1 Formylglycine-generating enzyme, required for sulfatase activity, contains SUMF1/FGE domain [Nitrosomonas sp. Nm51]